MVVSYWYGISMDSQWIMNGISMDSQRVSQWILNGVSMDSQWYFNGFLMVHMYLNGFSMVSFKMNFQYAGACSTYDYVIKSRQSTDMRVITWHYGVLTSILKASCIHSMVVIMI
jgi:hypothetical protein